MDESPAQSNALVRLRLVERAAGILLLGLSLPVLASVAALAALMLAVKIWGSDEPVNEFTAAMRSSWGTEFTFEYAMSLVLRGGPSLLGLIAGSFLLMRQDPSRATAPRSIHE